MRIEKELPKIQKNISLAKHTTFKIGGRARYFFVARTKKDLLLAIKTAKKFKLPFFISGGGSNLLVSDREVKGLVIKSQISNLKCQNSKIYVEAGTPLSSVVSKATKKCLTGLEWAVGIPGTVGGAIWGNAGAFRKSMKDIVESVEVLDVNKINPPKFCEAKLRWIKNKNCRFSYRNSIFKKNKNLIILSTKINLKKGNKKEIKKKIKEYLNYKKSTQPLNFPSAGSVFKNPKRFFAAELIKKCGLKGKKIGEAKISEKHANFIVNLGKAKAKDVKKLINLAKKQVKKKFKIILEEEIQYLS
jgi:UDP-N-acetylmuramate dehydrogenase